MFTKNFIKWTRLLFFYEAQSVVMVDGASHPVVRPYIMEEAFTLSHFMKQAKCEEAQVSLATYKDYSGVYFGSGSAPATADDYKLASPIISGLTIQNPNTIHIFRKSDGVYTASATFLLTNTSGAEITISEVGLIGLISGRYSESASASYHRTCLLERQVLSTPITIPDGDTKAVTYKLTFNQTQVV